MSRAQLNPNSILNHFAKDPGALRLEMAQVNFFDKSMPLKDRMYVIVGEECDVAFKKLICEEECYKQLEVSSHLPDTRLLWEWPADVKDD